MAQINHYPAVAHLRGAPSAQQLLWKGGRLRRSGRGLSFWFQPLSANLAEIPLDDRELAFIFHARTADFQEAVCQGTISYRVADAEALAARIDFSLDLDTGLYAENPLDQISDRLTQLAQQHVWGIVNRAALADLLASGVDQLRDAWAKLLGDEDLLSSFGLAPGDGMDAAFKVSATTAFARAGV